MNVTIVGLMVSLNRCEVGLSGDRSKSALDEIEKEIENIKVELLSKQKEHDDLKIKNLENGNSI